MEAIVGNRTFDTDSLPLLCTQISHSDFNPAAPTPTGITSKLDVFDAGAIYLLAFSITHQRSEDEADVVIAKGVIPLPPTLGRLIVAHFTAALGPQTDPRLNIGFVLRDIDKVLERLKKRAPADGRFTDLIYDIEEMRHCLGVGAFRGSLALAGRVLENCLKAIMEQEGIEFEDQWMVGTLLSRMAKSDLYVDPGLTNVWNIINQQRVAGVHAKEAVPIPSREQAIMVAYAVIDMLQRRLA
jgi:hypothetical protein